MVSTEGQNSKLPSLELDSQKNVSSCNSTEAVFFFKYIRSKNGPGQSTITIHVLLLLSTALFGFVPRFYM